MTPAVLPSRLSDKIRVSNGCWEWQASTIKGYGQIQWQMRRWVTHRLVWTMLVGDIPDGLVLDHLCRNRACCNPDHLRVCTLGENTLAPGSESVTARNALQTHCIHGHELSGDNLKVQASGQRTCRACNARRQREYVARRAA
jgi:hypothetical protein